MFFFWEITLYLNYDHFYTDPPKLWKYTLYPLNYTPFYTCPPKLLAPLLFFPKICLKHQKIPEFRLNHNKV